MQIARAEGPTRFLLPSVAHIFYRPRQSDRYALHCTGIAMQFYLVLSLTSGAICVSRLDAFVGYML